MTLAIGEKVSHTISVDMMMGIAAMRITHLYGDTFSLFIFENLLSAFASIIIIILYSLF